MSNARDIGKQAISKIAEVGIKTQLDEVDNLTVDVQASPQALANGEVESVTIDGEGLVMQDNLRTERLHVKTSPVAVNPLKAVFGNIKLRQMVEAQVEITLTQQDINRAFNSDYLKDKFQTLEINVEECSTALEPRQIQFCFPGEGRVRLQADIELINIGVHSRVAFTAVPTISPSAFQIILEQIAYENEVTPITELIAATLADITSELLDMRNFELTGMTLKLCDLAVLSGRLEIKACASIHEFPGS